MIILDKGENLNKIMINNSTPEISVIIPVYNVEPYIHKCLNSIKSQTFTDFEAIIVDDSSPDGSIKIALEFVESDPRFKIVTRENGGLSAARNTGLQHAVGKYVAFIDSDDFIAPTYLEKLYNACEKNNADMAYCNFIYYFYKSGLKKKQMFIVKDCVMERNEAITRIISDHGLHSYAWNKLYKRSIFCDNGIEYPTMYFEDVATSPKAVFYSNRLAVTGECLYYYVKRPGSILSTMNAKKINDLFLSVMIISNFLRKNDEYEKFKKPLLRVLHKFFLCNIYSIIRLHILAFSFKGIITNFKTNKKIMQYIKSCEWSVTDKIPALPYEIKSPTKGSIIKVGIRKN